MDEVVEGECESGVAYSIGVVVVSDCASTSSASSTNSSTSSTSGSASTVVDDPG
jgi:hypothetical protein